MEWDTSFFMRSVFDFSGAFLSQITMKPIITFERENMRTKKMVRVLGIAMGLLFAPPLTAQAADAEAWPDIRKQLYGERDVSSAATSDLVLYAPNQSADGALVPVSVHMPASIAKQAKQLTLIIDRNPAPIAASVTFGPVWQRDDDIGDRIFSTRVRVDSFSVMRAVLETTDGRLLMSHKFVAGAGGCSALPSKDIAQALADLGKVKLKTSSNTIRGGLWREGLAMIRHPNFTGMQLDPKSGDYTPARYVSKIEVTDGEQQIFTVDANISLSEDPNLRFTYPSNSNRLELNAVDSDGVQISGTTSGPPS